MFTYYRITNVLVFSDLICNNILCRFKKKKKKKYPILRVLHIVLFMLVLYQSTSIFKFWYFDNLTLLNSSSIYFLFYFFNLFFNGLFCARNEATKKAI